MVVADVARGDSTDYSAFHVFDTEQCKQVAEYRGKIGTTEYGNMLVSVATEYNNALLVIENANVGWAALQAAIDRDYQNLYYTYKHEGVHDAATQLTKNYDLKDRSQMTPGFTTSTRTRPLLISKLDIYFREKECIVRSRRLIDELSVFIWKNNRPEAQAGYNDDLVMAFAIGLFVRDTALKLRNEGMAMNKNALRLMGKTGAEGFSNKTHIQNDPWKMKMGGKGPDEDLTWLIK